MTAFKGMFKLSLPRFLPEQERAGTHRGCYWGQDVEEARHVLLPGEARFGPKKKGTSVEHTFTKSTLSNIMTF